MYDSLSHNNTISQAPKSHYHTIAIKYDSDSLLLMQKTEARKTIAIKHRAAIRKVMLQQGLRVAPWCRKAGITEGALRNFLNGDNDSMGANTLEMLARAAGVTVSELLGEETHYKADDNLMLKAAGSILKVARDKGIKMTRAEEMAYTVRLYNHVIEYRRQGSTSEPDEAMASLVLKRSVE